MAKGPRRTTLAPFKELLLDVFGGLLAPQRNGTLTVDYTEKDDKIERSGIIGVQVHGGAKTKAIYKDITIEELNK